ncbi:MAG: hypothetical protein HRT35_20415 [Algicola sp.]|nr:hypothetical protein [Algicola sp.]
MKITVTHNKVVYLKYTVVKLQEKGVPDEIIKTAVFDAEKRLRIIQINGCCHDAINQMFSEYPQFEVDTFTRQLELANAYFAEPSANHPALSALANHGLSLAETAQKIQDKNAKAEPAVFAFIGRRQQLTKQVNALTYDVNSVANIRDVSWA